MNVNNFNLISRQDLMDLSWNQGLSDVQIAQLYGVTANQVHEKRRRMNLIHGQVTSAQLQRIVGMTERIKTLPLEAINEIEQIVNRYV
ncbi:hypothetical protein [Alicyclobacillus mengziensis]|uniref:Uncharacterized protein n=1 Tax=Alicyclobacillus mengziensis TaxID=2931921 RepID=A0A9X7Z852_9BACL|nr:hypothetical protein [Alicyclobacillus mengziensis]QSO48050.1 hypothetical protein JZ786_03195 [Alicyclobacillus mengziensis]